MSRLDKTMMIILLAAPIGTGVLAGSAPWHQTDRDEDTDREDPAAAREWRQYEEGTSALDEGDWDEAVAAFSRVIRLNGRRADAALYWKAYALFKMSRRAEALSTLETLKRAHSGSRWLKDARALELEINQSGGKPVSPENQDDEELKLVAINGLMSSDPERAVPLLERVLAGGGSRRVKEQALFVLTQSGSQRAREIVFDIARGNRNPDLQRKAVEVLGLMGSSSARPLLREIYTSTADAAVKKAVLQAYMVSADTASLAEVARRERSPELRRDAINFLGANGADDELLSLYSSETDVRTREAILQGLAIGGSRHLLEIARSEKDPGMKRLAVQNLGIMGGEETERALVSIFIGERNEEVRKAALNGLLIHGSDDALIALARKEKDPRWRREIVQTLSVMGSKSAAEFMLEILEE
ncbi:MAG TPA: HEAT repeat domain-containing protein [Candidatus Polarisedimenticolia bacterium]|nr:HEAT repeat domain-containing protein [Candidatus Polarisedimenticolia bacterium]